MMSNTVTIIGLCGKKFAGKDTAAEQFARHGFYRLAFASPVKEIARVLFNFNDEQLYGDKKEEIDAVWKITPRHAMQIIGTEIFREKAELIVPEIGDRLWISILLNKIQSLVDAGYTKFVISDVRFENEAEALHSMKAKIVRVNRPETDSGNSFSSHASETVNVHADLVIENDDKIEKLFAEVDKIIKNLS